MQIGFQRRFDAGFRAARELVQSRQDGDRVRIRDDEPRRLPPPDAYIETSGGQFRDQLIHDFDVTRWLFGDEVEEITATRVDSRVRAVHGDGRCRDRSGPHAASGGAIGSASAARHNEAGYDIRVEVYGAKDTIAIGWDPRTPVALGGAGHAGARRTPLPVLLRALRRGIPGRARALPALREG